MAQSCSIEVRGNHPRRLRACDGLHRVIVASSSQVYGNADVLYLDENSLCRPISHYACSKLAMEHMAATYSDRLPIVTTRPFNYTGPGQAKNFFVPKIVERFVSKESSIELGNIDVVRDFSDVRTVVDVYCRLLEAPVDGEVFNICSGVGRSLQSVLDDISRLMQRKMRVVVQPELVRASEVRRQVGSNKKLVAAIGPLLHVDFNSTLASMAEAST